MFDNLITFYEECAATTDGFGGFLGFTVFVDLKALFIFLGYRVLSQLQSLNAFNGLLRLGAACAS